MNEEANDWWRQAQADMSAAAYNVQGGYWWVASWCVQQAVEKGLKGLLHDRTSLAPPRTHNLRYLGNQLSVPDEMRIDLLEIDPLFELTRYPYPDGGIPAERIAAPDAERHLAAGQRVLSWIENKLYPPAPTPL